MKGATQAAARLKSVFKSLRAKVGKAPRPVEGDPITQLIMGVLTRDTPESKASEALDALRAEVVDYNELRVIPLLELMEILGEFPEVRSKCEDISRALNKLFAIEHAVSMDRLAEMPPKDVVSYLARIDGLEPYTRARIRLLGLKHHAVPLDEAMWAYARREEIVDPKCSLDEAQAFLERQISAEEAVEFVALLKKVAWQEFATAVRKGGVERIRSIPPDRTTRNMLQQVASGLPTDKDEALEELPDLDVALGDGLPTEDAPEQPAAKKPRSRKPRPAASKTKSSAAEDGAAGRAAKPARSKSSRAKAS